MTERKWLAVCAAFALGEGLASLAPAFAEAWPVPVFAALLFALWGMAFSLPGWKLGCVCAAGMALFLFSSLESERGFRDRPWMRQVFAKRGRFERNEHSLAARLRGDFSRRMGIGLAHAPEAANMNRAILLGERRRIKPETRRAFVESGTVHIFAISGLHVMIIANIIIFLAAISAVPCRFLIFATAPPLWAYVWVIGFPPSAVRAALMATVYFAAPLFWRKPNAVIAWAVTFMAMHIVSPGLIGDIGSQLSFVVMLSLILAARQVRSFPKVWQSLVVAFAAWAAGVPIVAHCFGAVTPGGLLANLALVPVAVVAVGACFAGLASSWLSETLAAHINNFAALVTSAMAGVSGTVAKMPGANFEVRSWGAWECAAWYAALLALPAVIRFFVPKKPF
jgi:competence protein ComEC